MSKLETGIDGLEIRNTPGRGRSLYVTKAFKAGALVFEEDMMISMTGPVGDERMIQMERCCMKTNQVVLALFHLMLFVFNEANARLMNAARWILFSFTLD